MILNENWVEISSGSVQIQKPSAGAISLCYALQEPTTETTFSLIENKAVIYPASSTPGMKLYARSVGKDRSIKVVQLYTQSSDLISKTRIGKVNTLYYEEPIESGDTLNICIVTDNEIVTVEAITVGTTSIQTTVNLHEDSIFTDGSGIQLQSFNRNRNFKGDVFPIQDIEARPTISDEGTLVGSFTAYGEAGVGFSKNVLSSGDTSLPVILEPLTGYTAKVTNNDTSTRNYKITLYLSN